MNLKLFALLISLLVLVGCQSGGGTRISGASAEIDRDVDYALFFMNDAAMNYLNRSQGWEIGIGPSIVVVDAGVAKSLTTSTAKDNVYAFIFDQKGLMAGLGLQGSKITRIHPE